MPMRMDEYMAGDEDDKGNLITRIYVKNANHLIYEINDSGDIGMMMQNPAGYDWPAISRYTARISTLLKGRGEKKAFLSNLAKAYHDFFSGKSAEAAALFEAIEHDIVRHKMVVAKLNYLMTGLLLVMAMFLLMVAFKLIPQLAPFQQYQTLLFVAAFGSFGGFLSISFRVNKMQLDLEAGNLLPRLTAISRIFLAVLSSFVVVVVIRSNLVFGLVNDSENPYLWYTLAVLAGFSESFIPNILHQIEQRDTEDGVEG